jgi:hypothetical protein
LLRDLAVCKLSQCVALSLENTSICYPAANPQCPSNSSDSFVTKHSSAYATQLLVQLVTAAAQTCMQLPYSCSGDTPH